MKSTSRLVHTGLGISVMKLVQLSYHRFTERYLQKTWETSIFKYGSKLPSGTWFSLLVLPSRAGKQTRTVFHEIFLFWSGQKFCKSSLSHGILALLLLVLPEAWRQSHVKTLMEKATSLNSFDLQLQPGRFVFFLILYLCLAVICRS